MNLLLGRGRQRRLHGFFVWAAVTSFMVVASDSEYAAMGVRQFTPLAATHVIATVAMIVACFLLVATQGSLGAVTARAFGSLGRVLGCSIVVLRAVRLRSGELNP